MAKLLWAIPCQRVITDQATNSVTYVDAVEQFAVPKLPFRFPHVVIGTLWARSSKGEKITMRMEIFDPAGASVKKTGPFYGESELAIRHRIHVTLAGIPIEGEGQYRVEIQQRSGRKWSAVGEIVFDVELVDQSAVGG